MRMPTIGCAAASTSLSTPRRSRIRADSGERYSPQIFGRGNAALSSSSTDQPRSARKMAVALPAGPPPTTIASYGVIRALPLFRDRAEPEQGRVPAHRHALEPGARAESPHFLRGVGAADGERPVVARHASAPAETRDEPHRGPTEPAPREIVHDHAHPGHGAHRLEIHGGGGRLEMMQRQGGDGDVDRVLPE